MSLYIDVPLSAICGTQHINFADEEKGLTWRKAMLGKITGKNEDTEEISWTKEVISYFEDDIYDKSFAGADSLESKLELISYGGAVMSDNGAHRLVGAYCWQALKPEEEHKLRKARVSIREINRCLGRKLLQIAEGTKVNFVRYRKYDNTHQIQRDVELLHDRSIEPIAFLVALNRKAIWVLEAQEIIYLNTKVPFYKRIFSWFSASSILSYRIKKIDSLVTDLTNRSSSTELCAERLKYIVSTDWIDQCVEDSKQVTEDRMYSEDETFEDYKRRLDRADLKKF